ncbi:MAG: hypothetical protein ACKPBU_06890 [Alphaproteobacteria bacterium]
MGDAATRREDWRYGRILPLAARSRAFGRAAATILAHAEMRRDPGRTRVACERIARCLGVDADGAQRIHREALESEAREEVDAAWFMAHEDRIGPAFEQGGARLDPGPAILATLHFGSPVLAFVHLSRMPGARLAIVARPLDDSNPMPRAKREWARRKVAWTERASGRPFLSTDPESVARARSHLLDGGRLFTPVDVPGDVSARRSRVRLFGRVAEVSGGIEVLARLTRTPVQPVVAFPQGNGFRFWYGRRIEPGDGDEPLARAFVELERILRERPGDWWMWPYLDLKDPREASEERGPAAATGSEPRPR